jgi:hypothetical protein
VSERMWSVNLDASISGENQSLGEHSCWPLGELGAPAPSLGAPTTSLGTLTTGLGAPRSAGDNPESTDNKPESASNISGSTSSHRRAVWENNIFLQNTAGAPGNLSYYLSYNDF